MQNENQRALNPSLEVEGRVKFNYALGVNGKIGLSANAAQ